MGRDDRLLPSLSEMRDASSAIYGAVGDAVDRGRADQNFGPDDSVIASTLMHPAEGAKRGIEWLREQINTAAGIPNPNQQDEASMYQQGPSMDEQAQAGVNLAGMAQLGGMPGAPSSAGGTLGTTINGYAPGPEPAQFPGVNPGNYLNDAPIGSATGSRTDVAVGRQVPNGFNMAYGGREMPADMPSQNRQMRDYVLGYKPEGLQKWRRRGE